MTSFDRNLKQPESWMWNIEVERELPMNSVLSIGYVGRRGLHLWEVFDINQPAAGALQANPGVATNALRPYRGFSEIQQEESVANSMYHALQISWNKHYASGFAFGSSYTYSKSDDNSSNYRDIVPDTYNTSNLWGPSEFDTRHAAIITWTYDLPFFKAQNTLAGKVAGGWQISGIAQFQTGTPCGVGTNNDFAGVGEFGSFGCGNEGQFWVLNGPVTTPGAFAGPTGSANSPKYFSTTTSSGAALFTQPAPGTFNLQKGIRDEIYQPGFQNWNLGLFKRFPLNEKIALQFRAEAYNFINHPNWGGLNFNPASAQFGEVTSKATSNPRNLQLSLRLDF